MCPEMVRSFYLVAQVLYNVMAVILRAIVDIAVYSKQRRIERIVKDDESSIRSDTRV